MGIKKNIIKRVSEIDWGMYADSERPAPVYVSKGDIYDIVSEEFYKSNVIPYFVAEYIERCKFEKKTLIEVMAKSFEGTWSINGMNGYQEWIIANDELFSLAWVNGYSLEEVKNDQRR